MSKQSSLFSFFGAKKTTPKAEPVKRECCVLQTATVKAPAPIGSFFLANSTIEGKGWETAAFVFQFSNVMWPREVEGAGHRHAPGRTVSWNLFRDVVSRARAAVARAPQAGRIVLAAARECFFQRGRAARCGTVSAGVCHC